MDAEQYRMKMIAAEAKVKSLTEMVEVLKRLVLALSKSKQHEVALEPDEKPMRLH